MGLLFESRTCPRCHGSGHYSYCHRYGTTCFKCQGRKIVLTKRGEAAQRFLDGLQTVAVADLKPGQFIEVTSVTHGGDLFLYKSPVVLVQPATGIISSDGAGFVLIKTSHAKFGDSGLTTTKTGTVRVWPTLPANVDRALEYQASLTKAGTVRKTKKKA